MGTSGGASAYRPLAEQSMTSAQAAVQVPRAFLLDGASGAGKTSLGLQVASERDDVVFIPRYTTRTRRADTDEREYIFVDQEEFDHLASSGAFLEYRHYDFGMSYGLPRDAIELILNKGMNALAIINLGNVIEAKKSMPSAVSILIDVPMDVLRDRLLKRGVHRPDQIAERLRNARTVASFRDKYDFTVANAESLESAVSAIEDIIDHRNNILTDKNSWLTLR